MAIDDKSKALEDEYLSKMNTRLTDAIARMQKSRPSIDPSIADKSAKLNTHVQTRVQVKEFGGGMSEEELHQMYATSLDGINSVLEAKGSRQLAKSRVAKAEDSLRRHFASTSDVQQVLPGLDGTHARVKTDIVTLSKLYDSEKEDFKLFNTLYEDVDLGKMATLTQMENASRVYNQLAFLKGIPEEERIEFVQRNFDAKFGEGAYKLVTTPRDELSPEDVKMLSLFSMSTEQRAAKLKDPRRPITEAPTTDLLALNPSRAGFDYDQVEKLSMALQVGVGVTGGIISGPIGWGLLAAEIAHGVGSAVKGKDLLTEAMTAEGVKVPELSGIERGMYAGFSVLPVIGPMARSAATVAKGGKISTALPSDSLLKIFTDHNAILADDVFKQLIENPRMLDELLATKEGRYIAEIAQVANKNPEETLELVSKLGDSPLDILAKVANAGDRQAQEILNETIGKALVRSDSPEVRSAFDAIMGDSIQVAEQIQRDFRLLGNTSSMSLYNPLRLEGVNDWANTYRQAEANKLISRIDEMKAELNKPLRDFDDVVEEVVAEPLLKALPAPKETLLLPHTPGAIPKWIINMPHTLNVGDSVATPAGSTFKIVEVDYMDSMYRTVDEFGNQHVVGFNTGTQVKLDEMAMVAAKAKEEAQAVLSNHLQTTIQGKVAVKGDLAISNKGLEPVGSREPRRVFEIKPQIEGPKGELTTTNTGVSRVDPNDPLRVFEIKPQIEGPAGEATSGNKSFIESALEPDEILPPVKSVKEASGAIEGRVLDVVLSQPDVEKQGGVFVKALLASLTIPATIASSRTTSSKDSSKVPTRDAKERASWALGKLVDELRGKEVGGKKYISTRDAFYKDFQKSDPQAFNVLQESLSKGRLKVEDGKIVISSLTIDKKE